jgi:hypothetical protein
MAGGYVLGRRKKTRLALMLGGAALTGRLPGAAGQLMRSGSKVLGSSDLLGKAAPGLGEVGDMIKGDLTTVVKRAAATAISSQIESLSDQLRSRADAIREESAGRTRRAPEDEEPADEEPADDEPADDEPFDEEEPAGEAAGEPADDVEEEPEPPRRRPAARPRDERAEDDEPAVARPRTGARAGRTGRAASPARAASPIRRTQR